MAGATCSRRATGARGRGEKGLPAPSQAASPDAQSRSRATVSSGEALSTTTMRRSGRAPRAEGAAASRLSRQSMSASPAP